MENESSSWGIVIFFAALAFSWLFNLAYLILLHHVRGSKLTRVQNTGRALFFRSSTGDFRLDSVHRNVNYRPPKSTQWQTVPYDFLSPLTIQHDTKTSGIFEFFFSDFNLFDFAGRYRDLTHMATIMLKVPGDNDIPVMRLKQYEQREWFIGQMLHDLNLSILRRFGFYHELDAVAEQQLDRLNALFSQAGLIVKQ